MMKCFTLDGTKTNEKLRFGMLAIVYHYDL